MESKLVLGLGVATLSVVLIITTAKSETNSTIIKSSLAFNEVDYVRHLQLLIIWNKLSTMFAN